MDYSSSPDSRIGPVVDPSRTAGPTAGVAISSLALIAAGGSIYVLGVSPGLSWLLLVTLMCFAGTNRPLARRLLAIAVVAVAAAVYSSRDTAGSWNDDLANVYYPSYVGLREGSLALPLADPGDVFRVSSVEIALPALLRLIGFFPFTLSPAGLVFALTLVGGLLYMWWIEAFLLPDLPPGKRLAASALSLTLFSFGLCSQTARQMLGVPLLLAAIWDTRRGRAWGLTAAASLFHLSALPIFLGWRLIAAFPRASLVAVAAVAGTLVLRGAWLGQALLGVDVGALDKLQYYSQGNDPVLGLDRSLLPLVVALCAMAWLSRTYREGDIARLVLASSVMYVALLPLTLASFRLTLFALAGLLGPLAALALAPRTSDRGFAIAAFGLSALMLARRVAFTSPDSGMGLWHSFPPIDLAPFRYLSLLFY